ncbi:hypothetical protein LN042_10795 [Kitasatospora sp. RB6PN24]|uniref:hypothetical protein n=1 Tax=Kitasatospora humi TaxID=2893891 RepID=UPI001E3600CE|nr:hypothetical protein [Kitasatospora humi]MCC9307583.1 hypothetical protein [Kitasatospora humi]
MTDLSPAQYRDLLITAAGATFEADSVEPNLRLLYTPHTHRLALDPEVTVVQGERGTGKTVWARALTDDRLRGVAAAAYMMPRLRRATVTTGFGSWDSANEHPGPGTMRALFDSGADPVDIWHAVVLVALGDPALRDLDWPARVRWVAENPDAYERRLWDHDREARAKDTVQLILFDRLEHVYGTRRIDDLLVSGLLRVALELRMNTRCVRAKVFLRPDMFESAPRNFPDASKIRANPALLDWKTVGLYGLLFHQMGNAGGDLAARFREQTGVWQDEGDGRFVAPVDAMADAGRQEEIFAVIAGRYMGAKQKGYTYTWLPNHLQDGNQQVSPRSFLKAISTAAAYTRDNLATHELPLHHDAIRRGVRDASLLRVDEITEDIPWAAVAVGKLEGLQVPIEESAVRQCWNEKGLTAELDKMVVAQQELEVRSSGPRDTADHPSLIRQLEELGIMTRRRTDQRIDLPDVYRIAFGIGRKGGVRRSAT